MLMPPLIAKWNSLKDEDKDLFPLLEVIIIQLLLKMKSTKLLILKILLLQYLSYPIDFKLTSG